jgi:hypothetical protein
MIGHPLAYPVVWSKFPPDTCPDLELGPFGAPTHVLFRSHP